MAITSNTQKISGSSAVPYDSGTYTVENFIEVAGAGNNTFAFQDLTVKANLTLTGQSGDTTYIEATLGDFNVRQNGRNVYFESGNAVLKIGLSALSAKTTVTTTLVFLDGSITLSNKPGSKKVFINGLDDNGAASSQAITSSKTAVAVTVNPVANNAALNYFTAPDAHETFNLTTSVDTFVGTALVDVFTALPVNVVSGDLANTLTNYDSIDGGAGVDTFNIYTNAASTTNPDPTYNSLMPSTVTVKNVETINAYNDNSNGSSSWAFATNGDYTAIDGTDRGYHIDASRFVGATSINQFTVASDITNLAASTTAGFYNQADLDNNGVYITAATGASTVHVDLGNITGTAASDAAGFDGQAEAGWMDILGNALNTVNITGSLGVSGAINQSKASNSGLQQYMAFEVHTGLDVSKLTFTTSVNAELEVAPNSNGAALTTIDASASKGAISYTDDNFVQPFTVSTLLTGSGNDTVEIETVTSATVNALVQTNAGNDSVEIDTSGAGKTTAATGAGNDAVNIEAVSSGLLAVDLGADNDTFGAGTASNVIDVIAATGGTYVNGSAVIDGGAGTDTMSLIGIGSVNGGSFINFEVADVVGMGSSTLDLSLVKGITNLVGSGKLGSGSGSSASITNLGAGVGFTATADMSTSGWLTLSQATAAAMTVTLNVDNTVVDNSSASLILVDAKNATSLNAVFDSSSLFSTAGSVQEEDIMLTGDVATSLTIVSGGTNAENFMFYKYGVSSGAGVLTSVTVTGTQDLSLNFTAVSDALSKIATVNASAFTGDLYANLGDIKAGGTISLGSGDDWIWGQAGAPVSGIDTVFTEQRSVSGFEKASAENLTTVSGFDHLEIAIAVQAADHTAIDATDYTVKDGLLTFGTGGGNPGTIQAAVDIAQSALTANTALVFQFGANSYVLGENSDNTSEVLIQLTGTTGLHGLDNIADGDLYVF